MNWTNLNSMWSQYSFFDNLYSFFFVRLFVFYFIFVIQVQSRMKRRQMMEIKPYTGVCNKQQENMYSVQFHTLTVETRVYSINYYSNKCTTNERENERMREREERSESKNTLTNQKRNKKIKREKNTYTKNYTRPKPISSNTKHLQIHSIRFLLDLENFFPEKIPKLNFKLI